MKTDYYLLDPTRNTTLLVTSRVSVEEQPLAAGKLMKLEPLAEQVGFISGPSARDGSDISLRMAGGEFCGNATMSAAAYLCDREGMTGGQVREVTVSVSGTPEPVKVEVEATGSGRYHGTVAMPRPVSISEHDFTYGEAVYRLPLVEFEGISHIIAGKGPDRQTAEAAIRTWCRELGCSCLGIMLYNEEEARLDPLVYVPAADTLFWESSCASGTSAVGAYCAYRKGSEVMLRLSEPGGELGIYADPAGELKLSGHVRILRKAAGVEI